MKTHNIIYAYPSSPAAERVGKGKSAGGSELFGGVGAGYTLAQAEMFARNNRGNRVMNHPITGKPESDAIYTRLPDGVRVI